MKIRIHGEDIHNKFTEDYDINTVYPEKWAKNLYENFNKTLRSGEVPRKIIKVEILSEDNNNHDWVKKTDGMSQNFRGRCADIMYCRKCSITGKRYGLSRNVKRDSKYKAKKYEKCDK